MEYLLPKIVLLELSVVLKLTLDVLVERVHDRLAIAHHHHVRRAATYDMCQSFKLSSE